MLNNLNTKEIKILSVLNLKKKYSYLKKIIQYKLFLIKILRLSNDSKKYKYLSAVFDIQQLKKKGFYFQYIIHFSFLFNNIRLHITNAFGKLKFAASSGLVGFSGKQKKNKHLIFKNFITLLKQQQQFLKNKPIALHFKNIRYHKYYIINSLKEYFFITGIQNFNSYPYNGCRKKKKRRKRVRSKKR